MSDTTWGYKDENVIFKHGDEWLVALPEEIIQEITRLRVEVERLTKERDAWKHKADLYEQTLLDRHGGECISLLDELDAARAERDQLIERCAEVCEKEVMGQPSKGYHWEWGHGYNHGARACVYAIRAMKK